MHAPKRGYCGHPAASAASAERVWHCAEWPPSCVPAIAAGMRSGR